MTGKDLLIGIGNISHKYYDEAENDVIAAPQSPRVLRRPLLVAAIVALTLLLVGCAFTYILRMQHMKIGNRIVIQAVPNVAGSSEETMEVQLEVLSLQGMQDSPAYLANQEWLQFTQEYTPQLTESWDSDPAYWAYSVQDQTMVEKVDEICEKYGLKVIGKPWHEHLDCTTFLHLIGIEDLQRSDSDAVIRVPQGRFFEGGSFTIYGNILLSGETEPLYFTYQYVKKDVFYDVFAYVNPDTVTEQTYTTEEGQNLLLLESENSGMIMVDHEDCFISVDISLAEGISLEELAEHFDFTIYATAPDSAAANAREETSVAESKGEDPFAGRFERDTYGEYVEDVLWSDQWKLQNGFTDDEIPDRDAVLYDLDGNGEEELLIFYDGYIGSIISMQDGKTREGKSYHMMLCENNVLIHIDEFAPGEKRYHIFYFANDGDPVFSNPKEQSIVRLKEQNGQWWRTSSTDHYADFDTQITEAEAMEILNSYNPITLDVLPMTEFEAP